MRRFAISSSRAAALCAVLAASWVEAQGPDRRAQFGLVAAHAVEGALAGLFPGAALQWRDRVLLTRPDTPAEEIFLPGFLQRPISGGFLFATGLELEGPKKDAMKKVESLEVVPTGSAPTRLLLFRTNSSGDLLAERTGTLDTTAAVTQGLDLQILNTPANHTWPMLRIRYRSFHLHDTGSAAIEWTALVNGDSMSMVERVPTRVVVRPREGSPISEVLLPTRINPELIEIRGVTRGKTLRLPCATPCLVDAGAVLAESW